MSHQPPDDQLIQRVQLLRPPAERLMFFEEVPREMRAAISPHATRAAFCLPDWCRHLYLDWKPADGASNTVAEARVKFEYRWAVITVFGCWLQHSEYSRQRFLLHEYCHVLIDPLYHAVTGAIEDMTPDKVSERTVARAVGSRLEGVVEDTTNLLMTFPVFANLSREPAAVTTEEQS